MIQKMGVTKPSRVNKDHLRSERSRKAWVPLE